MYVFSLPLAKPSRRIMEDELLAALPSLEWLAEGDQEDDRAAAKDLHSDRKKERERALSARRKRVHRERLRDELQGLQRQVVELETRLGAMRSERDPPGRAGARVTVLRDLVVTHQRRRRAAEALNRRLKAQVARNSALMDELSAFASEQHVEQKVGRPEEACRLTDKSLLAAFVDELDEVYAKTEEEMRRFSSQPRELWSHDRSWRADAESGAEVLEIVDSFVLPFPFSKTGPALWQAMEAVYSQDDSLWEDPRDRPANTIAVNMRLSENVKDVGVSFVMREYVERHRTVIVWRALSEAMEGTKAGVSTDETGWSVLMPTLGDSRGEATFMNTFVRITPLVATDRASKSGTKDVASFVSRVLTLVVDDGDAISRLMDGLLLTDAPPAYHLQ